MLNSRSGDIQNAYYVPEGVDRLHSYLIGLSHAFEVSAIAASLSKESWSQTFYKPKNNGKALSTLREVLNAVTTVLASALRSRASGVRHWQVLPEAPCQLLPAVLRLPELPDRSSFNQRKSFHPYTIGELVRTYRSKDDRFEKDADLGAVLSKVVVESMKNFTSANNELMAGHNYANTGDMKTYLSGGAFVNFRGVDKNAVVDVINKILLGNAINQVWR